MEKSSKNQSKKDDQKDIKTIGEIAAENDVVNVEEPGRYFTGADKDTYIDEP